MNIENELKGEERVEQKQNRERWVLIDKEQIIATTKKKEGTNECRNEGTDERRTLKCAIFNQANEPECFTA